MRWMRGGVKLVASLLALSLAWEQEEGQGQGRGQGAVRLLRGPGAHEVFVYPAAQTCDDNSHPYVPPIDTDASTSTSSGDGSSSFRAFPEHCAENMSTALTVLQTVDLKASYSSLIQQRKVVFIGDSTMKHQAQSFCTIFHAFYTNDTALGLPLDLTGVCNISELSSSVYFWGYGMKSIYSQTQESHYLNSLRAFIETLGPGDVIMASAGIHWGRFCNTENREFRDERFEFYLHSLLRLLVGKEKVVNQHPINKNHNHHHHHDNDNHSSPILLWRESLPQHFPTSNGMFSPSPRMRAWRSTGGKGNGDARSGSSGGGSRSGALSICPPMTEDMYRGRSRVHETQSGTTITTATPVSTTATASRAARCEPTCLPANWQNIIARKYASSFSIPVLSVFDALVCQHAQHTTSGVPGDCSHYTDIINTFLNERFLHTLRSIIHQHELD